MAVRSVPDDPSVAALRDGAVPDGPPWSLDLGLAVFGVLALLGSASTVVGLVRRYRAADL